MVLVSPVLSLQSWKGYRKQVFATSTFRNIEAEGTAMVSQANNFLIDNCYQLSQRFAGFEKLQRNVFHVTLKTPIFRQMLSGWVHLLFGLIIIYAFKGVTQKYA